jgi:hypothetical protein
LGTALKVYAGDVNSPTEIFRGKVTAIEGRFPRNAPPELVVLSEDALQGARMRRRSKTWDVSSLGDIVNEIASGLSLTPSVNGLDFAIGIEQQFNESDLHFCAGCWPATMPTCRSWPMSCMPPRAGRCSATPCSST